MVTLDQLRPGQEGEILRVQGCDGIACRLREMGFVPGEAVKFLSAAPLGDPLNCIIQGSRIALRGSEAQRVCLLATKPATQPAGNMPAALREAMTSRPSAAVTVGAG
jgi:ferrous iron transport protein A